VSTIKQRIKIDKPKYYKPPPFTFPMKTARASGLVGPQPNGVALMEWRRFRSQDFFTLTQKTQRAHLIMQHFVSASKRQLGSFSVYICVCVVGCF